MEARKRVYLQDRIAKEAAALAKRLKGVACVSIVFFEDESGNFYHRLSGGAAPMPLLELYRQLYNSEAQMEGIRQQVDEAEEATKQ